MRESAHVKGRRYLTEGRLQLLEVHEDFVRGVCRGTGAVHAVSYAGGQWICSCPARRWCSHREAASLVTSPDGAVAVGRLIEKRERPKALERKQKAWKYRDLPDESREGLGQTVPKAAKAVGYGEQRYRQAKAIVEAAEEDPIASPPKEAL